MKLRINICHIYLIVILLCMLNGTLYKGGSFIAQALQYILILMSLYYAVYANVKYKLPVYFNALNVLLVMFTVYGMLLLISGEHLIVRQNFMETSNTDFLKSIYKSLLPVYPFFVFTRQGLLKEKTIKIWFFIFFVLAIRWFYNAQAHMLAAALERRSSAEEFTNNFGYTFLALLPALVLFYKKPVIQYLGLAVCGYFIVIGMKRGAILCGVICLLWFIVVNLKKVPKKRKWIVVLVSVAVVLAGIYLFNYMMETSSYFRYRLAQTEAGESSGRNDLYSIFYNHFIHEDNPLRFLFGNGANATLKIGDNFAHNDWLEIAINQGVLGLVIYLVYWICYLITWRKTKQHPQAFMAIGMIFIIYFLSTLFSMSYNSVSRCAAMVLGYYLAVASDTSVLVPEEPLNTSQTIRFEEDDTPQIINPVIK